MPTYAYKCNRCNKGFEAFSKSFRKENIGEGVSDVFCPTCKVSKVIRVWPNELDISVTIGEIRDRRDKEDEDNKKRVKDPDRAMRNRKKSFGSDNVNVSKSDLAKREHKIHKQIVPKAQGSTQDIDKTEFIKAAARNPNAVKAAEAVLKKAGKSA